MLKNRGGGREFVAGTFNEIRGDNSSVSSHGAAVASIVTDQVDRRKECYIRRVRDGISSHKVVYTCGCCGYRTCFKGLPNRGPTSHRGNNEVSEKGPNKISGSADGLKAGKVNRKFVASVDSSTIETASTNENEIDFVPLQVTDKATVKSVDPTLSSSSTTAGIRSPKIPITNLDQGRRAKKKKIVSTQKGGGKSGLMDFLSSLNDM